MFRFPAVVVGCFLLTLGLVPQLALAQIGAPDPGVPELAVLNRFNGKWEAKLQNSEEVIRATRKWMLNGRFQQHDFSLSSGNLSGIIYRGYDQQRQRYTLVMIDSQGSSSLLAGTWDQDQKTFTFRAIDSSCPLQQYESYFPDENTEQWTIITGGDNPIEVSGVAKRVGDF
jgi:hypothetical protein